MSLKPKTNPIYDDYLISKEVLGLGISGKVLSCTHKQTKVKYALKSLRENLKAKREIDLQWRACQGCPYIVKIIDVYENFTKTDRRILYVVMEVILF
jgi:serine/threonine protein kinase